jgi:ribonucleoside-diphosphate reductase alpha chain
METAQHTGGNRLNELGERIFLDRYALKDMTRLTLTAGDTVVVLVDSKTNQREIGLVTGLRPPRVEVELRDGTPMSLPIEHVDKPIETQPAQMMDRIARGIAAIEVTDEARAEWETKFRAILEDWKFVPAGRILAAAGSDQQLTYYNCYVIPSPADSRAGIIKTLAQMTEIMSRGGGVGINLSSLRPRHSYVRGVNGRSSGSVSWGALYSFVTGLIEQGGSRRGALMLILNDWHPDVFDFIDSKRTAGKITNANISVGVSDALLAAVKVDGDWDLVFPDTRHPEYNSRWDGDLGAWRAAGRPVITHKTVKARAVWDAVIESAWASAEPGVFFIDRYNAMSNSWYFAPIICTNPCGEQGLPAWGVCNLGAINLAKFYDAERNDVAWDALGETVRHAVRFLDNIIDATPYFFDQNRDQQLKERRVGLNTMGVAELMIRLGIRYGSEACVQWLDKLYEFIAVNAYEASIGLARERGAFPAFDAARHVQGGFMMSLPAHIRDAVREDGVRNVTLLTQAPNGTIGTMVDTSTGIEPFYSWTYFRKSRLGLHEQSVTVVDEWRQAHPGEALPDYFVTAMDLSPEEHVRVQAAIQRWVDSSISKTCNVPSNYTVDQVRALYELMYDLGCKGGTIYRDGSRDEQVLMLKSDVASGAKAEAPRIEVAAPAVAPLPTHRSGITVSRATPFGTIHVTSTHDEHGEPFEVFITIGKAGSDLQADVEALGRLISLTLRLDSPVSRLQRLKLVISQLEGIGGARSFGMGPNRVLSLPDAVGATLRQIYFIGDAPGINGTGNGNGHARADGVQLPIPDLAGQAATGRHAEHEPAGHIRGADLCPQCGMGSLVRSEGCRKCLSCGYSEC